MRRFAAGQAGRMCGGDHLPTPLEGATSLRPERLKLGQDPLAELVAGLGESKRRVCVQTLELWGIARAAYPELERRAAVSPLLPARQLAP